MYRWAAMQPGTEVFAQIGHGEYEPEHMRFARWLSGEEFAAKLEACTAVVSHAGTGTIMQVLALDKPLLVLPRRAAFGETRNDHQVGTARYFEDQGVLMAADDEDTLPARIEALAAWQPERGISDTASAELIERLRRFVNDTKTA